MSDVDLHSPEKYTVGLYVSQRLFDRLQRLVETGRLPRLRIALPDAGAPDAPPIRYRDPYNSSDVLQWDNQKHPRVEISWCTFDVELEPSKVLDDEESIPDDDHPNTGLAPLTRADLLGILHKFSKVTRQIDQVARKSRTPLWIVAALLALLSLGQWFGG